MRKRRHVITMKMESSNAGMATVTKYSAKMNEQSVNLLSLVFIPFCTLVSI